MGFSFNPDEVELKDGWELVPEGKHRARIEKIEETESKAGNDMLVVHVEVSGYSGTLKEYIVDGEFSNNMIGSILESIGILDSFKKNVAISKVIQMAKGKVGAISVKHEEYNGKPQPRIGFWLRRNKQDELPKWGMRSQSVSERSSTLNTTDPNGNSDYVAPDANDPNFDEIPF